MAARKFRLVLGGDGAKLLEPSEEVLDQVARLVEVTVVVAADLSVGFGRDYRGLAGSGERIDYALLGVECLVADQRVGLHSRQQVVGSNEIVSLTTGQVERDRIAERVDQGVDFGGRSSA